MRKLSSLYDRFKKLSFDGSWIGLENSDEIGGYFCTPIGATVIGWDNGIHYCFIEGFDDVVFCVNPETCCDHYVYPLAVNFADFLRLLIAMKNTNTMQQVILWDKQAYTDFVQSPYEIEYAARKEVNDTIEVIRAELGIEPMENPFEYIKEVQSDFPYDTIKYSDEFYDVTGFVKPKDTATFSCLD